jgi:hypothetical protein
LLTGYPVNIIKVVHKADFEDLNTVRETASGVLLLPPEVTICDFKFVDDESLMLLVRETGWYRF